MKAAIHVFFIAFLLCCASAYCRADATPIVTEDEVVAMSPLKVLASPVDMYVHCDRRGGKKIVQYIRVRRVAPTSIAGRAGLKKGDRIVAIGDLRLEGLELSSLIGRRIEGKIEDDAMIMTYLVRRAKTKGEICITLRYPKKKKEANHAPEPTRLTADCSERF
jgi:membrane-associated protease RseP (regulator of RpoE activity)